VGSKSVTRRCDFGGTGRSDLRCRDQKATCESPILITVALAHGRSFCADQWRDPLPLARRGSGR
jgi:hypothetical protein